MKKTWNKRLRDKRLAIKGLTIQKATYRAWQYLPEPYQKDPKMLQRYEKDWPEEKADAVFLAALAKGYDCDLEDISPLAARRLAALVGLGADLHVLASNSFAA